MELREERKESWKREYERIQEWPKNKEKSFKFHSIFSVILWIVIFAIGVVFWGWDLKDSLLVGVPIIIMFMLNFIVVFLVINVNEIIKYQHEKCLTSILQEKLLEEIIVTLREIKYNTKVNK